MASIYSNFWSWETPFDLFSFAYGIFSLLFRSYFIYFLSILGRLLSAAKYLILNAFGSFLSLIETIFGLILNENNLFSLALSLTTSVSSSLFVYGLLLSAVDNDLFPSSNYIPLCFWLFSRWYLGVYLRSSILLSRTYLISFWFNDLVCFGMDGLWIIDPSSQKDGLSIKKVTFLSISFFLEIYCMSISSFVEAEDKSDCFLQNLEVKILFLMLGWLSVEEGLLMRL